MQNKIVFPLRSLQIGSVIDKAITSQKDGRCNRSIMWYYENTRQYSSNLGEQGIIREVFLVGNTSVSICALGDYPGFSV